MDEKTTPDALAPVYEVRRENLRALAEGSAAGLARKLSVSAAYMSQLIGVTPTRTVSERMARRAEQALGLHQGWLDIKRG